MRRVTANKHTRKPRKDSRRIPIDGHREFGDGQDHKRYYRCWNCGFICDSERDVLDGPDGRTGIQTQSYYNHAYGDWSTGGDYLSLHEFTNVLCIGGSINHFHVALKAGAVHKNHLEPVATRGCPFCGCTNWRGDY